jgi:hypothetical protein
MQLHDNIVQLSATVQQPREGRQNPRLVSEKFAVVSVEVANPRGKCWIDVVGNGGLVGKLSTLAPGTTVNVTGRLDSSKGGDGRWRVRLWADAIEAADSAQSEAEAS